MNEGDPLTSEPTALSAAVRRAAQFDRSSVSASAGLLAAIPVVAVLGGSLAAGDPVAGATMGAGAMLVGIAWRTGGGRPPLALMATDAAVMATSTFVGCVTGSLAGLHLLVLCVWSLLGGMLISLGRRGGAVGTQAIIAVVVFGRFSEPAPQALGLAAFVLAGGGAQVLFLSIARWPTALRAQSTATSSAYRALAELAAAAADASALPAAVALDAAEATMSSPVLFGDPALMALRNLVAEGYRVRVSLNAIHALLRAESGPEPTAALALAVAELQLAASAIDGDVTATVALPRAAERFTLAVETPGPQPVARVLSALAGQLRAIAALAPAAGEIGDWRSRRPYRRTNQPLARRRDDLAQIRANLSLQSPAGRHALRLAVIVPIAELISHVLPLQRGYWMVVAAAAVLRPEFGATFTRGTERALGTCVGVALAGTIAAGLHPAGAVTVILVGCMAWAGYATFPASFAVGFAFITALVVLLLNVISPDTFATAEARLLDTLVGGALGLLAYAIWPTWARTSARQALADLIDAQRAYLGAVLVGRRLGHDLREPEMRALARHVRLARTAAEETVARSLSEPPARRIDAHQSQGILATMSRLMQAAHVLRVEVHDERDRPALPALAPLSREIDEQLRIVSGRLTATAQVTAREPTLPDLRAGYAAFAPACPPELGPTLLVGIDEVIDAANSLAGLTDPTPTHPDLTVT